MTRTPMRLAAAAAAAGTLLLLAGCSGGGDGGGDGGADGASSASGGSASERGFTSGDLDDGVAADAPAAAAERDTADHYRPAAKIDDLQQALIKKGTVELRSDDVAQAGHEVQKIVDRYSGQVTEEQTETSDDGDPSYSRVVLRVPVEHFGEAMDDLSAAADLVSAHTQQEDVTAELIDTKTRIAVQKRSIERITVLFDRAQSIRDIMAIEAQLSRRQADLESMEKRAAYLSNQSSYSTITVNIDRTPEKKAAVAKDDDDSGFVAGLKAGWGGLSTFAVGLATVLGALLPWLVVVVLVGPPALVLVRWLRRRLSGRRTGRTPSAA